MLRKRTALFVAALFLAGCGGRHEPPARTGRIISLAPSTTEILFALGLGDRVVGVSRFCSYPPAVKNKPVVGGLYDPNREKIAALRPDLVVGLETQQEIAGFLSQLRIPFVGVSHEHIDEILAAIRTIGSACGADQQAEALVEQLTRRRDELTVPLPSDPPRVLVCISRDETATRCYIAGRGTFYDELIERAGGVNACAETARKYPEISPEGVLALQPDVIMDIGPTAGADAWRRYAALPAVRNSRMAVLTNDYASVPGPRFIQLLADFREAVQR